MFFQSKPRSENRNSNPTSKSACAWNEDRNKNCSNHLDFRSPDGLCNHLTEPNFGRTGTPYQRILLPQYQKGLIISCLVSQTCLLCFQISSRSSWMVKNIQYFYNSIFPIDIVPVDKLVSSLRFVSYSYFTYALLLYIFALKEQLTSHEWALMTQIFHYQTSENYQLPFLVCPNPEDTKICPYWRIWPCKWVNS